MSDRISRKHFIGLVAGSIAGASAVSSAKGAWKGDNPITVENAKAGTANWRPTNQAENREIEGYANRTSVGAGQSISFFVNTASASYTVEIYRIGWYGGLGGRLMRTSGVRTGIKQTIPTPNATTGLCECNWKTPWTTTLPTGASAWVSGYYLAKLTTKEGKQSHIPFVVRDDARSASYMVQASVTTWQAYNNWGGKSLYDYNSTNSKKAVKVSFNRPYNSFGSTDFYNPYSGWELNNLRFFEREGYDVKYVTNLDIHEDPLRLYKVKAFISSGHDEYWSKTMRDNIEYVPNEGIGLAFLSANTAYWQVRFEPGLGNVANRTMVCYKSVAADPVSASTSTDVRATATGLWREVDQGGYLRPEAQMIGVQFYHFPVDADMVVKNTDYWLFEGTGLKDGDRLPGLVGYEVDEVTPDSPSNIVILADSAVQGEFTSGRHNMTIYGHPGGNLVFATGSMQWSWGLDDFFAGEIHSNRVNASAQQIMRNLMAGFVFS
jgi:hypothetical protein